MRKSRSAAQVENMGTGSEGGIGSENGLTRVECSDGPGSRVVGCASDRHYVGEVGCWDLEGRVWGTWLDV